LDFGWSVDQFNRQRVKTGLDCLCEELGVLVDLAKVRPSVFVIRAISVETGNFYPGTIIRN
jgi:hypothetical protein